MENNERGYRFKLLVHERGTCDSFSKKLIIGKVEIPDTKTITATFNNFFCNNWAKSCIENSEKDKNFKDYISKENTRLHENP